MAGGKAKKLNNGRLSYQVKHYKTKACKTCKLRSECTANKLGEFIERTEYQPYIIRNNKRVDENPNYYRQRQQIIEDQIGTLKRQWHFNYLLTREKQKVMGEVHLAFTSYNLRRLTSIFDFQTLMSKMKALFAGFSSLFFRSYELKTEVLSVSNHFAQKTPSSNQSSIIWQK